jgi:hypothetical protein
MDSIEIENLQELSQTTTTVVNMVNLQHLTEQFSQACIKCSKEWTEMKLLNSIYTYQPLLKTSFSCIASGFESIVNDNWNEFVTDFNEYHTSYEEYLPQSVFKLLNSNKEEYTLEFIEHKLNLIEELSSSKQVRKFSRICDKFHHFLQTSEDQVNKMLIVPPMLSLVYSQSSEKTVAIINQIQSIDKQLIQLQNEWKSMNIVDIMNKEELIEKREELMKCTKKKKQKKQQKQQKHQEEATEEQVVVVVESRKEIKKRRKREKRMNREETTTSTSNILKRGVEDVDLMKPLSSLKHGLESVGTDIKDTTIMILKKPKDLLNNNKFFNRILMRRDVNNCERPQSPE